MLLAVCLAVYLPAYAPLCIAVSTAVVRDVGGWEQRVMPGRGVQQGRSGTSPAVVTL